MEDKNLTEMYWKIFRNELNLKDAMKVFGISEDKSKDIIEDIKRSDVHDSGNFWISYMTLVSLAYEELVKLGEIDGNEIYHSSNPPNLGDIGFKKDGMYRFYDNDWHKF